jgi:uncharacterized protein YkwD
MYRRGDYLKRTLCLALALIVLAACGKSPEAPAPKPAPAPFATPASPPEPLPLPENPPEASELPPPPDKDAPEAIPEPVAATSAALAPNEPAAEPEPAEADTGIPISENLEVPPPAQKSELDTAKIELELLRLINGTRVQLGVEPLGLQDEMQYAARTRSAEALQKFTHARPDGTPYNTAVDEAGFSYAGKWHGENLASLSFTIGQLDENEAALKLFEGLNASPGHRENMARGNFAQAGIGVAAYIESETVTLASAQLFASF